jgi:hypothetical protein
MSSRDGVVMPPPDCPACGRPLDRIDHYAIEHLILRGDVFEPVGIADGDGDGGVYGLASEVDLRCGHCHTPVPREVRQFFYRRWYAVLQLGMG